MAEGVQQISDRMERLRAFDDTGAGVKGVLDSGILRLPDIFVRPPEELSEELTLKKSDQVQIPVIDLGGVEDVAGGGRSRVVEEVRKASETWGFFEAVNHGIPAAVLDGMIQAVREFNEQDVAEKKKYYSRDWSRRVRFNSNYDLFTARTVNWRDTLSISFPGSGSDSSRADPNDLPRPCRESIFEYSKHVKNLGNILLGLLSEALGLKTGHLESMECSSGHRLHCHYYSPCLEPDLAIGVTKHSDAGFLTILLQNQISGLQVHYQDHGWTFIPPQEA